jgi:hypothetical protein
MKKALFTAAALCAANLAFGQAPVAEPAAAPAASIPIGTRIVDVLSGYDDGGRRDPFMTLVTPKRPAAAATDTGPRSGLASVAIADVTVRGIMRSATRVLAILETPGKQSFVARPKDRLLDGQISAIDRDGVVFTEQTLGATPNQVRKALRPAGEDVR